MVRELAGVVGELVTAYTRSGRCEMLYKHLNAPNKIRSNVTDPGVHCKVKKKPRD